MKHTSVVLLVSFSCTLTCHRLPITICRCMDGYRYHTVGGLPRQAVRGYCMVTGYHFQVVTSHTGQDRIWILSMRYSNYIYLQFYFNLQIHGPGFSPGPKAKSVHPKRRRGKKIYAPNDFRLKRNPGSLLPRPPKSKLPKDDFDYFDFQNWEPMTLREYEENLKKVKRNTKATKNKLPITVPSLHLNPPIFGHDSIPIQESLISLRPTKDASVIKRQIPNTTPASSIQTVNEEVSTKIKKTSNKVYVDKLPITVPSLHLKPQKFEPNQIPTKESSLRYKKQTSSTKRTMSKTTPSSELIQKDL